MPVAGARKDRKPDHLAEVRTCCLVAGRQAAWMWSSPQAFSQSRTKASIRGRAARSASHAMSFMAFVRIEREMRWERDVAEQARSHPDQCQSAAQQSHARGAKGQFPEGSRMPRQSGRQTMDELGKPPRRDQRKQAKCAQHDFGGPPALASAQRGESVVQTGSGHDGFSRVQGRGVNWTRSALSFHGECAWGA